MNTKKKDKIFISHSTKDREYVKAFVELLEALGMGEKEIICSSVSPYCIPLGNDIYKWLIEQFQEYKLHVFFMLSHNYYDSVPSMNEMGAAWAVKQKFDMVLLPGFEFSEVEGCIGSGTIGMKLDDPDTETLHFRLEEMKNHLTEEFGLPGMSSTLWERKRNDFLKKIAEIRVEEPDESERLPETSGEESLSRISFTARTSAEWPQSISAPACVLLAYASEDKNGRIYDNTTLSGRSIFTAEYTFNRNETPRELAVWDGAIDELYASCLIKKDTSSRKGFKSYTVTSKGYGLADVIKDQNEIDTGEC